MSDCHGVEVGGDTPSPRGLVTAHPAFPDSPAGLGAATVPRTPFSGFAVLLAVLGFSCLP